LAASRRIGPCGKERQRNNTKAAGTKKRQPVGAMALRHAAVDCDKALTLGAATAKTLVETINAAAAVDDFLFAGIKRVALRTDVDMKIFTARRTRLYGVPTTAGGSYSGVIGVYICFHYKELLVIGAAT
jgi:hypothetical protein